MTASGQRITDHKKLLSRINSEFIEIIVISGGKGRKRESKIALKKLKSADTHSVPRTFLLNIDSASNSEAVILKSRWKIVKQNMLEYANYDNHFSIGVPVKKSPQEKVNAILGSMAGKVLTSK